jgi:glucuronoarabinoxylan endo-1,4-beta-xylanase
LVVYFLPQHEKSAREVEPHRRIAGSAQPRLSTGSAGRETLENFTVATQLRRMIPVQIRSRLIGAAAGFFLAALPFTASAYSLTLEAELGALGSDFTNGTDGATQFISISTSSTSTKPGSAARVVTFTNTFPATGTYELYARVRVGSGTFNDDSMFYGHGFGVKSPALTSDWILVNNLANVGYTASGDVVTGGGSAASGVWKWINLSQFAPGAAFTVTDTNVPQVFQIGGREDGLDMDKFVFGTAGLAFSVADLDSGADGSPAIPGACTVNWNDVRQRIDGFGASSAFRGSTWTAAQADMFFSTNNGIGLSFCRNQIQPGGYANANEIALMQMAQARGAKVWSAPWSPAAAFKDNDNTVGGNFLSASNAAYARQLASYVVTMKNTYGVDLYALSIQNEPDANVGYVSCTWSGQQIHDFVPYLRSALVASNVASTRIMLPESQNWPDYQNLTSPAMTDPTVASQVDILGYHNYDGLDGPGNLTKNTYGKALWETEVSKLSSAGAFDPSIADGLYWAVRIHLFLTVAQVNSWHYWWLIGLNPDNEGLTDSSVNPAKRMYVLGQFSRFIRPNYYRIGAAYDSAALVSAYQDTNSGCFAIVAINTNAVSVDETFNLSGFPAVASVTPWITSASLSLVSQPAVAVSGSSFTYTVPPESVVSLVGQASSAAPNTAPSFTAVGNQTVNPGGTVVVTNTAVDSDVPAQSLAFSLLDGPTGGNLTTLDANRARFTWRAPVGFASTTNHVAVQVADDGTPPLSATNRFDVIVNPLAPAALEAVGLSSGHLSFSVTAPVEPDYTILTSTNLMGWQALTTTNAPFTFVETNAASEPARFYRVLLGP